MNLNINVNVNFCKDQEERKQKAARAPDGGERRSAKKPGDPAAGGRGGEHPLLNINGAKSSVNFYREGRAKKTSMFVNALTQDAGASSVTSKRLYTMDQFNPEWGGPVAESEKQRAFPRAHGSTTSANSGHHASKQAGAGGTRPKECAPIRIRHKRKREEEAGYGSLLYGDVSCALKAGGAGREQHLDFQAFKDPSRHHQALSTKTRPKACNGVSQSQSQHPVAFAQPVKKRQQLSNQAFYGAASALST